MQREIRHARPLPQCKCGNAPRHYIDLRGQRHMIECCPCGISTGKLDTFDAAMSAWTGERARVITPMRAVR